MSKIRHKSAAELPEIAEQLGCTVRFARPNELLLDIDFDIPLGLWKDASARVLDHLSRQFSTPLTITGWRSKNDHLHVSIVLESYVGEIPYPVAIGLQAALGSDPVREISLLDEYWEKLNQPPENTRCLFVPKEK